MRNASCVTNMSYMFWLSENNETLDAGTLSEKTFSN